MTTSGTAAFNPSITEIMEEAYERAGLELRSGYDIKTARRSLNILAAEWSNRGLNLWTIEQGTQTLTPGTATYTLPSDTIDLIEHVCRTTVNGSPTDLTMSRISVSDYSAIPTKGTQGRPVQIYVNRQATPQFTVWPVPDSSTTYTVVYWRLRRIQDATSGANPSGDNTFDIPSRFIPAIIAGLAYYIAMKKPDAADRISMLKQIYEEQFQLAADEDRDRASDRFVPFVGYNWT